MTDIALHLALALVAFVAGTIDAMAGGGGLLTVPALLLAGLPPQVALATNKIQSCWGSGAATVRFVRAGTLRLRDNWGAVAATFAGAAVGAVLMLSADPSTLRRAVPVVLVVVALYFVFGPRIDPDAARPARLPRWVFAGLIAPLVGCYDGFLGPGTGTFFMIALVATQGMALRRATATTKLLNFTSNITSVAVFLAIGTIDWSIGLSMAVGQLCGGTLGAHLVLGRHVRIVRPLLVTVSILTSVVLFLKE